MSFGAFVWLLFLGVAVAALLLQFLFSRLLMRLLQQRLGDTFRLVILAHAIAWIFAAAGWAAFSLRGGGHPVLAVFLSLLPALVELAVDAMRLLRRRARFRDAVYISRMR